MTHSHLAMTVALLVTCLASCTSTQLAQNRKAVTSISFSPDHELLAFANANEIQVLESDSFRHVQTLRQFSEGSTSDQPYLIRHGVGDSMVFLDGDRIASSGMGGLVTIWNVHDNRRLASIEPLPGGEYASTIDYSPVSNRLVIGTNTGQVLLASLEDDHIGSLVPLAKLEGYVWDLQFSRDGRYVASASMEPGKRRKSDPGDEPADAFAKELNDPAGDETTIDEGAEPADDFARSMNRVVSDRSGVIIWNLDHMEMSGELEGADGVLRMRLVPGETALLTAGEDIEIWEFMTREQYGEIKDPSMVMQGIGIGAIVLVGVASLGAVGAGFMPPSDLLMMPGPSVIPTSAFIQNACVRIAAISPDGQTIVSTTRGPTHNVMAVIDRVENKVVEKWTSDIAVCDLQFSKDGASLFAATSKGIFLFNTTNWKKKDLKKLIVKGSR